MSWRQAVSSQRSTWSCSCVFSMVIFLTERVLTSRVFTATFLLVRRGDTLHRRGTLMFPVDSQTQKLLAREHAELLRQAKARPSAPRRVAAWRSRRRSGRAARTRSRSPLGARSDTTRRFGNGVLTCVLADGERASARQLPDGRLVLRTETEAGLAPASLRARRGRRSHAVPRAFPRRRAARRPDPPPEGPASDPHGDGHARAPARDRQPADHVARGALDRVAAHPRNDGAPSAACRRRRFLTISAGSLPPSSIGSSFRLERRLLSFASVAPLIPNGCGGSRRTQLRPGSSANAGSARTRSASSGRKGSGASIGASSATSAC